MKNGWAKALLTEILFDGSNYIIYVNKSIASGQSLKFVHKLTMFSFPFTFHFGNVNFISGKSVHPCQISSEGVPKHLNILKI